MKRSSDSGDDKPAPEDLGETPFMVKWDLTNASPVFKLCNEVVKYYYLTFTTHNNINNNNKDVKSFFTTLGDETPSQDVKSFLTTLLRDRRARRIRSFLETWATNYGEQIILHFWIYGASTPFELIKLYELSRQTVNNIITKLESIDFIRKTVTVQSGGKKSWIYTLTIADHPASIDAKIRHDELKKRKREEDKAQEKEKRRLAAEEIHRKNEARTRLKDAKIQTLVIEFTGHYEKTKEPVSLMEITRRTKAVGLDNNYAYLEVAVALEEKGVQTGYYVDGKLDPTWEPPPEIRQARERRGRLSIDV
jgi:hypothetical protein